MIKFMAFLMFGGLVLASCSEDNEDETITVNFEGDYYNALIDDAQYGGKLIYSGDEYKWTDKATSLSSEVVKADWSAWGMGYGWDHGIAISNYINPQAESYKEQLAVSKASGNFAVAFDNNSELTFADGKAHHVVSIDLAPVAYAYNSMKKACGDGYEFDVILTFENRASASVSPTGAPASAQRIISLAKDNDVQDGFKTYPIDLDATSIRITFDGTDKNDWGLVTPKYVAIDNIVIKK